MKLTSCQYTIYSKLSSLEEKNGYMAAVDWITNEVKQKRISPADCEAALTHFLIVLGD